ncbi:MAG: hypothetical protein E7369_01345 [Clostridiales bacterium]|nr:hypothetical protein [Clostridiales bacterium]
MSENQEKVEAFEVDKSVQTEMKKCPACGANLVFDPDKQMLYCSHCGTKQSISMDLNASELDIRLSLTSNGTWGREEATVFKCDNCGAKVVLQNDKTAINCPFCGTPHVVKTDELAGLKPNALLPFAFGLEKAVEYAKAWAKKRLYAPSKFKKTLSTENVNGVYTPCFTFDSITTSTYYGRIGNRHTRTVGSGKNRRTETYIVWRNISGRHGDSFDDVLITAGSKFDQKKLDKISPYDTNSSKAYEENFLLGFMAYHYDCELQDCWEAAKKRIDVAIKNAILSGYSYDVLDYINVSTDHANVTYKYVMLPVYIGNYKYKKKFYNFFVNGTTGKVWGKTPISALRVIFTVLLGLAVIGGIFAIVYFTGG